MEMQAVKKSLQENIKNEKSKNTHEKLSLKDMKSIKENIDTSSNTWINQAINKSSKTKSER